MINKKITMNEFNRNNTFERNAFMLEIVQWLSHANVFTVRTN